MIAAVFITVTDIIGLGLLVILLIFVLGMWIIIRCTERIEQFGCKHEAYFEDRECNAICEGCGKNLGFIGKVREERAGD